MFGKYWMAIRICKTRDPDSSYNNYYRLDYQKFPFGRPTIIILDTDEALLRMLAETPHKRLTWSGIPTSDRISLEKRIRDQRS